MREELRPHWKVVRNTGRCGLRHPLRRPANSELIRASVSLEDQVVGVFAVAGRFEVPRQTRVGCPLYRRSITQAEKQHGAAKPRAMNVNWEDRAHQGFGLFGFTI